MHMLQHDLLRRTVQHARLRTTFYTAERYPELTPADPAAPPDLRCWPLLRREDVVAHAAELTAGGYERGANSHTEGTTGTPLRVVRSREEMDYVFAYAQGLVDAAGSTGVAKPLVLALGNPYHGEAVPMPSVGTSLSGSVLDDDSIAACARLLQITNPLPERAERISLLTGLLFHVHFLTSYLMERRIDPSSTAVRTIVVTGSYATPAMRRFIADAWKATLYDRFSLTESAAGATRCLRCGDFHFDANVVAEALDVVTGLPAAEGIGELVLTDLYPFARMQPMLRYVTGDLVRRVRSACKPHAFTFAFLGKTRNCIWQNAGGTARWLLLYNDYFDVLTELPDVALTEVFSAVTTAFDRSAGSRPIQTIEVAERDNRTVITCTIELRYAPHCFPDRTDELRRTIVRRLRESPTALAEQLDRGAAELQVRFVSPGMLHGASTLYV
jgi:phenylacetate-coenzyme A ligase PaaK-like adenylate-forming protein